jgi:hypothetical protein
VRKRSQSSHTPQPHVPWHVLPEERFPSPAASPQPAPQFRCIVQVRSLETPGRPGKRVVGVHVLPGLPSSAGLACESCPLGMAFAARHLGLNDSADEMATDKLLCLPSRSERWREAIPSATSGSTKRVAKATKLPHNTLESPSDLHSLTTRTDSRRLWMPSPQPGTSMAKPSAPGVVSAATTDSVQRETIGSVQTRDWGQVTDR